MMNAKKEIHGRLDLTGNLDGFTTSTTATTSNRNCAQTACIDNNNNDDDDASDDLRLDDFIGISETESNDLSEGLFKGSVKSSSSVRRSKKLVRRRKSAADVSSPPSPLSPVIVVDVVDGRKDEEDEGEEVEGVTLKDAGNEKGVEEEEGGEGDEDVEEELKKKNSSDADMDFGVLEAVSSHLNVEMSKQKTSLRKRGSLARRKRPTRHTVTLPTGASDNADETPRTTFSSQMDISDDVNSGKQSILDSSGDAADTPKKFLPRKPPMMIPGLEDLKQSKLFKQESQNRDNQSSPIISATATTTTTTTTKKSPQFPNVGQRRGSDDQAPESTAETGTGRSNSMYKMPLWLTEMKAKTIAKTQPALLSSETVSDTQSKRNEDLNAANLDLLQTGYGSSIAPRSAMSTMDASTAKKGDGLWLKNRGLSPAGAGAGSKENKQEKELDRPAWMRTALQKTSRVADSLQGQKDNQDNRQNEDGDDASTVPPWAAELKRKNRPLVGVDHAATGINRSEKAETPSKKSTETRERDTYMPSWANRNQPNSPNTSSPQNKATNGSPADVKGAKGIPTHTGEIPSWKLELAERRKRRQSLQEGVEAGGSSNSRDDVTDSPSNSLTALRQQLKPRKSSIPTSERSSGEGGSNPNPDWTKTVEERRARLLKSGLLGQASEESHC